MNSHTLFTNIRESLQSIFHCKHSHWVLPRVVVHGKDHGVDFSRRTCKRCGETQYRVHHRYGDLRKSWRKLENENSKQPN